MYNIIIIGATEDYIRTLSDLDILKSSEVFNVVYSTTDAGSLPEIMSSHDIGIFIIDADIEEPDCFEILKTVNDKVCGKMCVILTGKQADFDTARKALVHGAADYLVKPVSNDALSDSLYRISARIEKCLKAKRRSETDHLCSEISDQIIRGGSDLGSMTDALIGICIHNRTISYSNTHRIIHAVEKIYDEVCNTHEWITDLIPEPDVILKNITSSGDSETRETILGFLSDISDTIRKYYPDGLYGITKTAVDYILDNRFTKLTLANVADSCYVNKAHLSHMFTQNMGVSFTEYVSSLKMQMLRRMVISSSKQLSEIADILGYDDYKYMGRIFKSTYGIPPSELRNDPDS